MRSRSRLIRTEITTLIGLAMRGPIDFSLPAPEVLSDYIPAGGGPIGRTPPSDVAAFRRAASIPSVLLLPTPTPFTFGSFLREPIFYGGGVRIPLPIS